MKGNSCLFIPFPIGSKSLFENPKYCDWVNSNSVSSQRKIIHRLTPTKIGVIRTIVPNISSNLLRLTIAWATCNKATEMYASSSCDFINCRFSIAIATWWAAPWIKAYFSSHISWDELISRFEPVKSIKSAPFKLVCEARGNKTSKSFSRS